MGHLEWPALVFCKQKTSFLPQFSKINPNLNIVDSANYFLKVFVKSKAIQLVGLLFSCMRGIGPFSGTHSGKSR